MRVIQKQISLEDFTSRLPGVVPAYVPGTNEPIFFDEDSLKAREYVYTSNYGLIPMSVKIPNDIANKIVGVNKVCCTDPGCKEENKVIALSWETISDWYCFFADYYHLLNDWGHCHMTYTSAVDYYNHESKNGYADQMRYGVFREAYEELDTLYKSRTFAYDTIQKCIPNMDIPKEYQDYWHSTKLYYPDIVKWLGWFKDRSQYSGKKLEECSGFTDCCDCTEYVNRGGQDMADKLQAAYNAIQGNIRNISTCEPNFVEDISLLVSIDDMGEFSIFSEEYKVGKDYRNGRYGDSGNTSGGTVTFRNGVAMTLKDGGPGYAFDTTYMEKIDDPEQWIIHNGDTLCGGVTEESDDVIHSQDTVPTGYYGFDWNMVKKTGTTENAVRSAIAGRYKITPLDDIIIDLVPYDVEELEYGNYNADSAKTICVYREEYTETPYTLVGGKKVYGDMCTLPTSGASYYFPFFKTTATTTVKDECGNNIKKNMYKLFPRTKGTVTKTFINYGGASYEIGSGPTVTVNGTEYYRVDGEFIDEEGRHYVYGTTTYSIEDYDLVEDDGYTISDGYAQKNIDYDVDVYEYGVVDSVTSSKLTSLRCNTTLVDDAGDPLEGRYNVSGKTNHQPPEGEVLDLLYEKGNTANIVPFEELGDGYYYGDMITDMTFYYVDYYNEKHPSGGTPWSGSSRETISGMTIPADTDSGTVWCDIEYVIGATLSGTVQSGDSGTSESGLTIGIVYKPLPEGEFCPGVKYKETVRFVRTEVQYKLARPKEGLIPTMSTLPVANSLCYPVVCYVLEQDMKEIESNFGNKYEYPVSEFRMEMPPKGGWSGYSHDTGILPVFREEYLFGNSMPQKLDVDIYIERGTNAAFEKHIKLGEVTSMEALEQLGNGYYKMMDN